MPVYLTLLFAVFKTPMLLACVLILIILQCFMFFTNMMTAFIKASALNPAFTINNDWKLHSHSKFCFRLSCSEKPRQCHADGRRRAAAVFAGQTWVLAAASALFWAVLSDPINNTFCADDCVADLDKFHKHSLMGGGWSDTDRGDGYRFAAFFDPVAG